MSKAILGALLVLGSMVLASGLAAKEEEPASTSPYLDLKPAFTLNVGTANARVSFAKVDITLRVMPEADKSRIRHHQPALRNIVVDILSNQPLEVVENSVNRDTLRTRALEEIQAFLEKEEGKPLVTDLLFTSFIVQR